MSGTLVGVSGIIITDVTTGAAYDTLGADNTPGPQPYILSASCDYGYDIHVATAKVTFRGAQASGGAPFAVQGFNYWDTVSLSMGVTYTYGTPPGTPAGTVVRFRGLVTGFSYTMYPGTIVMECRGFLVLADEYENTNGPTGTNTYGGTNICGTGLIDAPASITASTTDCIVKQVLTQCGCTSGYWQQSGSDYVIQGVGNVLGTLAQQDYLWAQDESGLAYLERIEEIAEGFRTYDQLGGYVTRTQVDTIIPMSPSSPYAPFTEGVDILIGSSPRSVIPVKNRIVVQGWTPPNGITLGLSVQASSTYVPGGSGNYVPEDLTSRLLECNLDGDIGSGVGISCHAAGTWLLGQLNQLQVKLDLTTYRDDLIYPGTLIELTSLDLDLVSAYLWIQHVHVEVAEDGAFSQKLTCLRGAA